MIQFAKDLMDKDAQRSNDSPTTDALIELDDSVLDQIGGGGEFSPIGDLAVYCLRQMSVVNPILLHDPVSVVECIEPRTASQLRARVSRIIFDSRKSHGAHMLSLRFRRAQLLAQPP